MCVLPNNVTLPPFLQMGSACHWCSWCWCIWRWSCSLSFAFSQMGTQSYAGKKVAPACFSKISVAKSWKFYRNEDLCESTQSDFRKALQTSKSNNYFRWEKFQRYPSHSFAAFFLGNRLLRPLFLRISMLIVWFRVHFFLSIYTRKLFSYSSSSTLHPCE